MWSVFVCVLVLERRLFPWTLRRKCMSVSLVSVESATTTVLITEADMWATEAPKVCGWCISQTSVRSGLKALSGGGADAEGFCRVSLKRQGQIVEVCAFPVLVTLGVRRSSLGFSPLGDAPEAEQCLSVGLGQGKSLSEAQVQQVYYFYPKAFVCFKILTFQPPPSNKQINLKNSILFINNLLPINCN